MTQNQYEHMGLVVILFISMTNNIIAVQRNFTRNSLFPFGLFLMNENIGNNPKVI